MAKFLHYIIISRVRLNKQPVMKNKLYYQGSVLITSHALLTCFLLSKIPYLHVRLILSVVYLSVSVHVKYKASIVVCLCIAIWPANQSVGVCTSVRELEVLHFLGEIMNAQNDQEIRSLFILVSC